MSTRFRWMNLGVRDEWEGKPVLWIDASTYFPYAYEKSEAYISIRGQGVNIQKEIQLEGHPNRDYQRCIAVNKGTTNRYHAPDGVPYIFSDIYEIEKIENIVITIIYSYTNGMGERIKVAIYHMEQVRLIGAEQNGASGQDFLIKASLTTIPALLEGDERGVQRKIISRYDEILQAMIDLRSWQIFLNSIRSENGTKQSEAEKMVKGIIRDMSCKGALEGADRCILNILYNNDVKLIEPLPQP